MSPEGRGRSGTGVGNQDLLISGSLDPKFSAAPIPGTLGFNRINQNKTGIMSRKERGRAGWRILRGVAGRENSLTSKGTFGRGISSRHIILAGAALLAGAVHLGGMARVSPSQAYEPADLAKIEARLRTKHAQIGHMTTSQMDEVLMGGAGSGGTAIFDVREAVEFSVSRLPGAERVDPEISADDFFARFGDAVAGRRIVFYCSVGVRSSKLAAALKAQLMARGAKGIYNLQGGVFRWHNEHRTLVDGTGTQTDRVHPYNNYWGGLIARRDLATTEPRAQ